MKWELGLAQLTSPSLSSCGENRYQLDVLRTFKVLQDGNQPCPDLASGFFVSSISEWAISDHLHVSYIQFEVKFDENLEKIRKSEYNIQRWRKFHFGYISRTNYLISGVVYLFNYRRRLPYIM